jgi:hypothetical protein
MPQYCKDYQCSQCGRLMQRWWLPPTSIRVDCDCGAEWRPDPAKFVAAWGRWSAWVGWVLGTAATLAVMIVMFPGQLSWLIYLLASLGGGSVAAGVSWGVGRIVALIVGILMGDNGPVSRPDKSPGCSGLCSLRAAQPENVVRRTCTVGSLSIPWRLLPHRHPCLQRRFVLHPGGAGLHSG